MSVDDIMDMVAERLSIQRPEPLNMPHEDPGSEVFGFEPVSPAASLDRDGTSIQASSRARVRVVYDQKV